MGMITFTRGDDHTFAIAVTNPDGTATDITGATLRWTAKTNLGDTDAQAVMVKTSLTPPGSGITIDTPTSGLASLIFVPSDTLAFLKETQLFYDLQITSGGKTETIDSGWVVVTMDVSITAP